MAHTWIASVASSASVAASLASDFGASFVGATAASGS